jgi:GT2 family glycosyltransferase/SAM-dependent methyltransferase/glycosyltransferase involved in cell wall biosynthesis
VGVKETIVEARGCVRQSPEPLRPATAGCAALPDGNFALPRPKNALPFTGERMTSAIDGQIAFEHYHRYCVARDICIGKDVLDVASGEGYGSALLATVARRVVGIEIDGASVVHARAEYVAPNLDFIVGDAQALPLPDGLFDVVVSFETIEHLRDQNAFLGELRRVLRPGGVLLISVPDRDVYSAPGQPVNPFHVRELSCAELDKFLAGLFARRCIFRQRALIGSIIAPIAETGGGWRSYEQRAPDMVEAAPGLSRAPYLIGVASDGPLPRLGGSLYSHLESIDEVLGAKSAVDQARREARAITVRLTAASEQIAAIHASAWWRLGAPLRHMEQCWLPRLKAQWRRILSPSKSREADMRAILGLPPPVDPKPEPSQLRLPSSTSRPLVSLVIPTFGKVDYTLRCLASIAAAPPQVSIETIVVDDASGDPRVAALENVRGIRLVLRKANLGFLRSCNDAARLAQGELLMLLNNDTEVGPGAIDALAGLLLQRHDVGLVGARLLYPNCEQQEAGGVVWSDGSMWNYGRRDDPRKPEYCYLREVDYVSGAAMMLRRSLWEQLGGFDEHFAPAYCEDSDLAFRVRAAGLKVFYQPEACVVHHEGVSHGTDLRSGGKAHQAINMPKLSARWQEVLRRDHLPAGQSVMRARDRSLHRKITLVIDHAVPQPDHDAGSRAILSFMEALIATGRVVKFFPANRAAPAVYTRALQRRGIEVFYEPWCGKFDEWIAATGTEIDEVLLSRPNVAEECLGPLRAYCRAPIVYFGHDLHHARLRRELKADQDPARRAAADAMEALERRVWREVDLVLYPSEEEAAAVRALEPGVAVRAVPIYSLPPPLPARDRAPPAARLMFVGGFLHPPNVDAAIWLVRDILPRVRRAYPNLSLALVGSNPTADVTALAGDGIEVTGFVPEEELASRYATARVAVCPLRFGAGVKFKVVEAMYHGLPLVTTAVGAQGLEGIDAVCDVTESEQAIAAAVIRLIADDALWSARSKAQAAFVATRFSTGAVRDAIDAAFRAAAGAERFVAMKS